MGKKEKVSVLIEGGKATAAPPLGPALGPLKVNIGQVVSDINKKTQDFKSMKVPVDVIVDVNDKSYEIKIGTPPASQLIKKEAGLEKGSGKPDKEIVGNITLQGVLKVTNMKLDDLNATTKKSGVREIAGTCYSLGINVDGKPAKKFIKEVREGNYDDKIKED